MVTLGLISVVVFAFIYALKPLLISLFVPKQFPKTLQAEFGGEWKVTEVDGHDLELENEDFGKVKVNRFLLNNTMVFIYDRLLLSFISIYFSILALVIYKSEIEFNFLSCLIFASLAFVALLTQYLFLVPHFKAGQEFFDHEGEVFTILGVGNHYYLISRKHKLEAISINSFEKNFYDMYMDS